MNKPEITQQDRERIFALYWDQKVVKGTLNALFNTSYALGSPFMKHLAGNYILEVTPLQDITDEHAIECAKLNPSFHQTGEYTVYRNPLLQPVVSSGEGYKYEKVIIEKDQLNPAQVDYLRSKGYALPYLNYTVDQLIKEGVFKLKTETK